MNIPQQTGVVEAAFRLSRGGEAAHPADLYVAVRAHWRGD